MTNETVYPAPFRVIEEVLRPGCPDRWVHPEWGMHFPWLVQGTTGRTVTVETKDAVSGPQEGVRSPDFALFRDDQPTGETVQWVALAGSLGFPTIVGSHQVHGKTVLFHDEIDSDGTGVGIHEANITPAADGHISAAQGVLMGVTVADCIPVFLADPTRRALALLPAGWRGVVAGVLETGIRDLGARFGSRPRDIFVHMGPAICGSCYEVGPEVHKALGMPAPDEPTAVDLRTILGQHALAEGILEGHITVSASCTLCPGSPFFSHRRGDGERQLGFLGIRPLP